MKKTVINDIPRNKAISKAEMKKVIGGGINKGLEAKEPMSVNPCDENGIVIWAIYIGD